MLDLAHRRPDLFIDELAHRRDQHCLVVVHAPLLLIASLCIVAGVVHALLLLIASLCIVAGVVHALLLPPMLARRQGGTR
jgi:hypothetical protein